MTATYPQAPGHRRTDTSEAAAESMSGEAATLRADCLALLRLRGPRTADELADAMGRTVLAIRPRVTELKRLGLAEDTGDRRKNRSGRSAAVVRAVPLGPPRQMEMQLT